MNKKYISIIIMLLSILFLWVSAESKKVWFTNFDKSKNILEKEIYTSLTGSLDRTDFYCWCKYDKSKNIKLDTCWYKNIIKWYKSRWKKIEWEHIVPAENFWRWFIEWREWTKNCIKKWKQIKGRDCAKTNSDFNKMEWDMYNLYPVVWELNAIRSNLDYYVFNTGSVIKKNKIYNYSWCSYIVDNENKIAQPKWDIRWDIARTYMYFANKYPKYFSISDKNMKVYKVWDKIDAVSDDECRRYKKIKQISWEENNILKDLCK